MAFKTLSRATAIVATCGILAGCVAPHQHAFDEAWSRCMADPPVPLSANCAQAAQLGSIVEAEKQQQAASAAAVASGLLAVSAGFAAGYAATHPVYTAPSVVVVCHWGC